jgi:hypothetical protein
MVNKNIQLTEEQQGRLNQKIKEWVDNIVNIKFDAAKAEKAVKWLYDKLAAVPENEVTGMPAIHIARSPKEAVDIAWELRKRENPESPRSDYAFMINANMSDYGWVCYHEFFLEEGLEVDMEFDDYVKNYVPAGIYDAIAYNTDIVLVKKPIKVCVDSQFRLHATDGPCVEWEDGWKQYLVHGRQVSEDLFTKPITQEQFLTETNADTRGAMYEILGERGVMELLNTEVVESQSFVHAEGYVENLELIRTIDTFPEIGDERFVWVKQECPSTGTTYYIGCPPDTTDLLKAKKFMDGFLEEEEYFYHKAT